MFPINGSLGGDGKVLLFFHVVCFMKTRMVMKNIKHKRNIMIIFCKFGFFKCFS